MPAPEERNLYSSLQSLKRTSPLESGHATSREAKDFQAVTGYKHLVPTGRKPGGAPAISRAPSEPAQCKNRKMAGLTLIGYCFESFSLLPLGEGLGMRVYGAILFYISTV